MAHDLFFSLDLLDSFPTASLMVQDRSGEYRPATAEELLLAA